MIGTKFHEQVSGIERLISTQDFESGMTSFAGYAKLLSRISENFANLLQQRISNGMLQQSHFAVDYCCVAMQKISDEPFRYPGQGVYLTEFG
ncbi:hypothetical protein [Paraburkholderia bonniea]|uniref:hypothetical protein n=1 Tax=Paraburkholderia bonniea TaxID=2152891 RepID=UPI0012919009|nr:hypothetical protein [Paraburkholderia bonniea]